MTIPDYIAFGVLLALMPWGGDGCLPNASDCSWLRVEQSQVKPKKPDNNRHSNDGGEDSILHILPNHNLRLWKSRDGKSHLMV